MNPESHIKFKVAICGGGIAGLALASFLSKSGNISVDIFEVKPEIRTIGAGIAVWKRYWDVLQDLHGIEKDCIEQGIAVPEWSKIRGPVLRKSDSSTEGFDFFSLNLGPTILPRTALLDILQTKLNPEFCRIHTNKRLINYTSPESQGPVTLHFDDGTTSTADLLVGADGVHSRVRATMFKHDSKYAEPQFSGQYAYRMKCLKNDLRKINPNHMALSGFKIWCGKGRHVTSNGLGDYIQMTAYDNVPRNVDVAITDQWVLDVPAEEVSDSYQDWEPDLVSLLRTTKEASRWAIHIVEALPYYVSGHVALVGDAAHAMTPHQGLGGGQGMEDAYILWRLLADPSTTTSNLTEVLNIYDKIRRPFSQKVAARSLANGLIYGFLLPGYENMSLEDIGKDLGASCEWLMVDGGCTEESIKAETMLRELKL